MEVAKIRELIQKTEKSNEYVVLTRNFDFLMRERIKLVENQMRETVGRPLKDVDKEEILKSVKAINEIAYKQGVDLHISEDWNTIEAFLRLSILDDIASEFEKQKVN